MTAAPGAPAVMTIANLAAMQVLAQVPELDVGKVANGQPVAVSVNALPGQKIPGAVTSINLLPGSQTTVQYGTAVLMPTPPPGMRPGMSASVSITTRQANDVTFLPSVAVTPVGGPDSGQGTVQVLQPDGSTAPRTIGTGLSSDTVTQVTSGLSLGDLVVLPDQSATSAATLRGLNGGGGRGAGGGGGRTGAGDDPADVPVLDVRRMSKVYGEGDTAVHALREVDLVVRRGEYVAVVGQSGSGKSTLLNILGCLDGPTSGRYLLDGLDVADLDERQQSVLRNRQIGFIFQSFNLIPRTSAFANVELPMVYAGVSRRDRRARTLAALDLVGLAGRIDSRPNQLSGGQQQRVAVARALVTRPALLLADEPTGNLDSASTEDVLDLFDNLHATGRTIVLITHDHEVAERADRTVVVTDGRLTERTGARP